MFFVVFKARTMLFVLIPCFALLLGVYAWQQATIEVFPWDSKRVVVMGHMLDPKADDLEQQIADLTEQMSQQPIDAQYDPINKSVVPEISGFEIDVKETVFKIQQAKNGEHIIPEWREIEAQITRQDFADLPIYNGNPIKEQISLVVNVSWGNEYLLEMLEILEREQVNVSFFLVGRWAEQNEDLVNQIFAAGHEFGNHGYSDPHMKDLTPEQIKHEIQLTNEVVQGLTGRPLQWFSPPYGEKVEKIYQAAAELDMHTVLWSLDTIDWTLPGEQAIVQRIVPNLHNGAIILMHPTEQTPAALEEIIIGAKQQEMDIVPVTELLDSSFWPQKYSSLWLGH